MSSNGEKRYHVEFVKDEDLPGEHTWVLIQHDGDVWLAIKRDSVTEATLERCWAAFRRWFSSETSES